MEADVLPRDLLAEKMGTISPDVLERISHLRAKVAAILREEPPRP